MNQEPPEEERFMTNVLDLTDLIHELASTCWDAGCKDINPALVGIASKYLANYGNVALINTFIKYSHEYWHEIRERNDLFFFEHANSIFQHLPIDTNNINAFNVFFTAVYEDGEHIIIEEDREAIWNIFDSLVKICIKYIHRERGIQLEDTGEGLKPRYVKRFFPEIKVREKAKKWKIELPIFGHK